MAEAFIYDAIRTPRGKGRSSGALHTVKPVDLVVGLIDELRRRHPDLDPQRIDDLLLGVVTPVGDQGGDIAVTAAIAAGLPDTVAGVQLNRFCASGLDAVNMAAQKVRSGWSSAVLAGGVESMSRVPMGTDGGALLFDPATAYDARAVMPGIAGDVCATLEAQSREDVDTFALRSQHRAAAAWSGGYFVKSVIPVRDRVGNVILEHDEHVRPGLTLEDLGKLNPSFDTIGDLAGFDASALQHFHWLEQVDHVHTPGNSSGIVDGAALVLVGDEEIGRDYGLTPRARIVSAAVTRSQPDFMLFGVFPATAKALAMAGLTVEDIDLFEINEAFASIVLKYQNDLNLPAEKVNVNGGAIAMGHPLGATGAMLLGTVLDELERRDLRRGLVTLCAAGGIGIATIVERI